MKFPALAPKALCDYYNGLSECPKDAKNILERLLTEIKEMDIVWDGYRKAYPEDIGLCIVRDELFPLVIRYYRESILERRPWSESSQKASDVANKAGELARCIKDTEFDPIFYYIIPDIQYTPTLKLLTNDSTDTTEETKLSGFTFYELLKHIEKEAKSKINILKLTKELELGNSSFRFVSNIRDNAYVNYFIRKMALVFYMHFGSYRERMLSRLVSVVLNLKIDETKVGSSLREWHNSYPYLKEVIKDPLFLKSLLEPAAYFPQVMSKLTENK
jgi:hypothetical protein